jgi:hypothetical protein
VNFKNFISIILFCLIANELFSQKLNYEISDNPSRMFELKNYQRAKELYQEQYKKDLSDKKIKYRFGVCLVYTYELENGIKALEFISKDPSTPIDVWFHLAKAYHFSNRYDKSITLYKKYKNLPGAKSDLIIEATRSIEMCANAKILLKNPINIEFENLGKKINSKGREYLPIITPDESMLFYTTRRLGTTGRIFDLEGYYTADIFLSKYKYGKWSKARSIGSPNSYGNEQTAGISEDGETILYYVNNPQSKNNLQISNKSKSSFKRSIEIESKEILPTFVKLASLISKSPVTSKSPPTLTLPVTVRLPPELKVIFAVALAAAVSDTPVVNTSLVAFALALNVPSAIAWIPAATVAPSVPSASPAANSSEPITSFATISFSSDFNCNIIGRLSSVAVCVNVNPTL